MLINNEEIAIQSKWKDRTWCREVLDDCQYRFLEQTIPLVRAVYQDNWDLRLRFSTVMTSSPVMKRNDYGFSWMDVETVYESRLEGVDFYIHFPQFEIKNSRDQKHTIIDLYVRLRFNYRTTFFDADKPYGIRGTVTTVEYRNKYRHSHLPRVDFNIESHRQEFGKFCLGEGGMFTSYTMLRSAIQESDTANNYTINSEVFRLYLLQLKDYIPWESIEGGPHIQMQEIGNREYAPQELNQVNGGTAAAIFREYLRKYNRNNLPDIDWKLENERFKIINNAKFDASFSVISSSYKFFRDPSGNYFREGNGDLTTIQRGMRNLETPLFIYKGQWINFKVIEPQNPEPEFDRTLYVHPSSKNYVRTELENTVNKKALIRDNC